MKKSGRFCLSFVLVCSYLLDADATTTTTTARSAFEDAQAMFIEAEDGETEAIDSVEQKFAELLAKEPDNPVYRAYHGSAIAQRSNTTMIPWRKISWVKRGLKELDAMLQALGADHERKQLRGVPLILEAKLVAAGTFVTLPRIFDRFSQGAKLLAEVQAAPSFQATPNVFKGAVLWRAAQMYHEEGQDKQARQSAEQAIAFDPALGKSHRAKELLKQTAD